MKTTDILVRSPEGGWSRTWDGRSALPLGWPARFVAMPSSTGEIVVRDVGRGAGSPTTKFQVQNDRWTRFDGAGVEFKRVSDRPIATGGQALSVNVGFEEDSSLFKRSIGAGFSALLVLMIAAQFFGRDTAKLSGEQADVIPEQFAKVLLKPKPKTETRMARSAPAGGAATETESPIPGVKTSNAKAESAAVVKAFRSKALQSAVSGLLKGGMTSLLAAKSELLVGDPRHSAARVFDRAAVGNFPSSPDASFGDGKGVQVASLGGGAGGGAGGGVGGSVGYGAGRQAGVAGQGESFVSLDLPNAMVEEGLTREEVGRVIHSHISEIRYCYESSMLRSPDLEGKLVLDFSIGSNGAVKTAAVKESSLNDARLDDCILRRLTKWSFPKPNGGVDVAVSYPFVFKALKR